MMYPCPLLTLSSGPSANDCYVKVASTIASVPMVLRGLPESPQALLEQNGFVKLSIGPSAFK